MHKYVVYIVYLISFALSFYCLAKSYSFFTGANHLESIISGAPLRYTVPFVSVTDEYFLSLENGSRDLTDTEVCRSEMKYSANARSVPLPPIRREPLTAVSVL